MEMVETDPLVSVKQEIEYVCVKQESPDVQEWEVLDDWNDAQDPLSIDKEECPSSEDHLTSSTFSIVKTENEDNEGHTGSNDDGEIVAIKVTEEKMPNFRLRRLGVESKQFSRTYIALTPTQ